MATHKYNRRQFVKFAGALGTGIPAATLIGCNTEPSGDAPAEAVTNAGQMSNTERKFPEGFFWGTATLQHTSTPHFRNSAS